VPDIDQSSLFEVEGRAIISSSWALDSAEEPRKNSNDRSNSNSNPSHILSYIITKDTKSPAASGKLASKDDSCRMNSFANPSTSQHTHTTMASMSVVSSHIIPTVNVAMFRILIVDDAATILKMSSTMLRRKGYEVETAVNGLDALEKIDASEKPFDLILMDLQMPIMDGLEAIRRIRQSEAIRIYGLIDDEDDDASGSPVDEDVSTHYTHYTDPNKPNTFRTEASADKQHRVHPEHGAPSHQSHTAAHRDPANNSHSDDNKLFVSVRNDNRPDANPRTVDRLGANPEANRTPLFIIGVSACSDSETIEDAFTAGADVFIAKPFTMDSFLQATKQLREDMILRVGSNTGISIAASSMESGASVSNKVGEIVRMDIGGLGANPSQNVSHVTFFDEDDPDNSDVNSIHGKTGLGNQLSGSGTKPSSITEGRIDDMV
jgi:CheY-like chemotaxis protein